MVAKLMACTPQLLFVVVPGPGEARQVPEGWLSPVSSVPEAKLSTACGEPDVQVPGPGLPFEGWTLSIVRMLQVPSSMTSITICGTGNSVPLGQPLGSQRSRMRRRFDPLPFPDV